MRDLLFAQLRNDAEKNCIVCKDDNTMYFGKKEKLLQSSFVLGFTAPGAIPGAVFRLYAELFLDPLDSGE